MGIDATSFEEVFALLLELAKEGAYATVDVLKAREDTFAVLTHDMTFLARDDETDEPIGVLGLIEEAWWYSLDTYLLGKWIYIKPEHRATGEGLKPGPVLAGLLEAARDEAEERDKLLFIGINNPDRNAKRAGRIFVDAQMLGYVPHAYLLKLR